jgi:chromosome segregation protein
VNEYFLNGNPVRLKDVDLFLGTGIGLNSYAIIEQGKIESFIQMKPLERRIVIEETSGITRFEEKNGMLSRDWEKHRPTLNRLMIYTRK